MIAKPTTNPSPRQGSAHGVKKGPFPSRDTQSPKQVDSSPSLVGQGWEIKHQGAGWFPRPLSERKHTFSQQ